MNNTTDPESQLIAVSDGIARELIPAMVYLVVLMLLGTVGNLLVFFVFFFRLRMSTQNCLIVALAAFDLLSCLISMPTEIAVIRNFLTFDSDFACRLLRFINHYCAIASSLTLLVIAGDRYMKVCRPFQRQMSQKHVKIALLVIPLVALIFALPATVLYGIRSVEVDGLPILGHDCSFNDSVKDTAYPLVYKSVLFAIFFPMLGMLTVIYGLIWREMRHHRLYTANKKYVPVASEKNDTTTLCRQAKLDAGGEADKVELGLGDTNFVAAENQTQVLEDAVKNQPAQRFEVGTPVSENYRKCAADMTCVSAATYPQTSPSERSVGVQAVPPPPNHPTDVQTTAADALCSEGRGHGGGDSPPMRSSETETDGVSVHGEGNTPPKRSSETDGVSVHGGGNSPPRRSPKTETDGVSVHSGGDTPPKRSSETDGGDTPSRLSPETETDEDGASNALETSATHTTAGAKCRVSEVKSRKTIFIAMAVSVLFFLSFLPHLTLVVVWTIDKHFNRHLHGAGLVLYHIFFRSYFINSVASPFIYGALNARFRGECLRLFRQTCSVGNGS